jgi:thymidylate synthase (FAD)
LFPVVWEAFLDYRMQSISLTRLDCEVIQTLTRQAAAAGSAPPFTEDAFMAAQHSGWSALSRSRERDECLAKLRQLGLVK